MRPNMVETAVQWFHMSRARVAEFSGHGTAGKVETNLKVTFSYGDTPVLANQQRHQLCGDTGCSLENLPEAIENKDKWWETLCC